MKSLLCAWTNVWTKLSNAQRSRRNRRGRQQETTLQVEQLEAREVMAGENLLHNGSFELEPVATTQKWDVYSSLPGWTLASGPKIEVQAGVAGKASDGTQFVELDGDTNGPTGSSPSQEHGSSAIEQQVTLATGRSYVLQFDFAARGGTGANDNKLEYTITMGDQVLKSETLTTTTSSWKTITVAFDVPSTGEGGPATASVAIKFADKGVDDTYGTYLDNVRLFEKPATDPLKPQVSIQLTTLGLVREADVSTPAKIELNRTGSTSEALTVYVTVIGVGDAPATEDDYTIASATSGTLASNGMVTFAAGESKVTLIVNAKQDNVTGEPKYETVQASLGYSSDYEGTGSVDVQIENDYRTNLSPGDCMCSCMCVQSGSVSLDAGTADAIASFIVSPLVALVSASSWNPHPLLETTVKLDPRAYGVTSIEVRAHIADLPVQKSYFQPGNARGGDVVRLATVVDTSGLESGLYNYTLEIIVTYADLSTRTQTQTDSLEVENLRDSAYGNRWRPANVDRLIVSDDGNSILQVGTGGTYNNYTRLSVDEGTGRTTYERPDGEGGFSILVAEALGIAYRRFDKMGNVSTYDSDGRLVLVKTPNGQETSYGYTDGDGDGESDEIAAVSDSFGRVNTFDYAGGRLSTITDEAGRVTSFHYDLEGTLAYIRSPDPDGAGPQAAAETSYAYDPVTLKMTSSTNALGETTYFTYDVFGNATSMTTPNCGCFNTTSTIDPAASKGAANIYAGIGTLSQFAVAAKLDELFSTITDERGNTSREYYDIHGRVVTTVDPTGYTTVYTRNRDGLVTRIVQQDPDGAGPLTSLTTQFVYDDRGNLLKSIAANGATETYTYDRVFSVVASYTDAVGRRTVFDVDRANGNVLSARRIVGLDDLVSAETNDVTTSFTYTTLPTTTTSPPGGLVETITDALGRVSRYVYDATGRMTSLVHAEGTVDEATEHFEYDAADNLTAFVDGLGRRTESTYNNLDQLIELSLPDSDGAGPEGNAVYQFTYDALHRQTSATDPLGRTTNTIYERLGRTIRTQTPDHDGDGNPTESVVLLNALGLVASTSDPLGRTTTYDYDTLNRVSQITSPDPDGTGPQTASTLTYAYDRLGRIVGATDALGRTTTYQYDRVGNLISVTEPDADLTDSVVAPKSSFTYNGNNELTSVTDALNRKTSYTYDALGRLTRMTLPDPDGTGPQSASAIQYGYDKVGNLITETNALGKVTSYAYDARDRLTTITDADPDGGGALTSPVTHYTYDDANQLTSVTDPLGRTTTYEYDGLGRKITTIQADPDGAGPQTSPVWHSVYDLAGRLTSVIDASGNATTYGFDDLDNLVSVTGADPDGSGPQSAPVQSYSYDDAGQLLSSTDPLGRVTSYAYDALGRLLSQTQPDPDGAGPLAASVWSYAHDAVGNLLSSTDGLGRTTTYGYDRLDRQISVTQPDPDGAGPQAAPVLRWAYDNVGQVVSATDALGNVTGYAYDAMGRLTTTTDALFGITSYAYDKNSNLTKVTDALGRATTYSYDALDRLTQVKQADPDGTGPLGSPVTKYKYDAAGQLVETINPLNRSTKYQYDALGRLTQETDALNQATTYAYDAVGNLTATADPLGRTTQYQYDNLYRQTAVVDPLSGVTSYGYDLAGNLTSLTDPIGNATTWAYDGLDRMTAETNELGASRTFGYDAVGNLTSRTDRNGRTIGYGYDALDRRTSESWLDGASTVYTASYTYDANGRLTNAGDAFSAYAFGYDALGRITSIDNAGTPSLPHVVMNQTFDAVGNRTSVSATVNGTADFRNDYVYDNLDRMTRVTQAGQSGGAAVDDKRVDFAYNGLGQFTAVTRYSDAAGTQQVVKTTYSYDAADRLTTLKHAHNTTTLAQYSFQYNAASEITRIVSPDGVADYTYDATGQLTGANNSILTDETYTYDANGNRTSGGAVVTPNNQILLDGVYTYQYDAEGNRTRRTSIATGEYDVYVWDFHNRLTSVETHASDGTLLQSVSFTYDVFDRRLAKTVDADGAGAGVATQEQFVYDGDQVALVFDGAGSLTNRYMYGPAVDQVLADEQLVDGLFQRTIWPLADHLGTVRDLAGDAGTVLNHRKYSAFGDLLSESNASIHERFGFTGRDYDAETGLSYHRARYYDPALGRWLSEDPIGFVAGDANLRRYVGNSPLNAFDPSGFEEQTPRQYVQGVLQREIARLGLREQAPNGRGPRSAPSRTPTLSMMHGSDHLANAFANCSSGDLASRAQSEGWGFFEIAEQFAQGHVNNGGVNIPPPPWMSAEYNRRLRNYNAAFQVAQDTLVLAGSVACEPIDWAVAATDIYNNPTSPAAWGGVMLAAAPFISSSVAKAAGKAIGFGADAGKLDAPLKPDVDTSLATGSAPSGASPGVPSPSSGTPTPISGSSGTPSGSGSSASSSPSPTGASTPSGTSAIPGISTKLSVQKQNRHVQGTKEWKRSDEGSYVKTLAEAEEVLKAAHSGAATVLGKNSAGHMIVKYPGVTGYNNNRGAGFVDQPTNVFLIKGSESPSVVPYNPTWKPPSP